MSKVRIELIYDNDCPNVPVARENIQKAIGDDDVHFDLSEWDRSHPDSPPYAASYGSPTVLVDGADVSGEDTESDAKSCRVYLDESGGIQGAPTSDMIQRAIAQSSAGGAKRRGSRFAAIAAIVSTLGAVSIPALACPACWPAYLALLGAAGIGYFDFTPYLIPSIVISVVIALAAIGYESYRSRAISPFVVGVAGAILVLGGRFWLLSDLLMYGGIVVLLASLVMNGFTRKAENCCS